MSTVCYLVRLVCHRDVNPVYRQKHMRDMICTNTDWNLSYCVKMESRTEWPALRGGGDGGEEVLPKGCVSRQEGFQSVGIRVYTNTKKTKCKLSKRSKWSCPCILFPLTDPVQVIWFTNKFASCSMCVF